MEQGFWAKLIGAARELSGEVAYLLIFLVIVAVIASLSTLRDVFSGTQDPLLYLSSIALLAVIFLGSAILVVWMRQGRRVPVAVPSAKCPDVNDEKLNEVLEVMVNSFTKVGKIQNPLFRSAIYAECAQLRPAIALWAEGEFLTEARTDNILKVLYRNAENSVFATTVQAYNEDVWYRGTAREIIDAHKQNPNNTHVDRVFLFRDRDGIRVEDVKAMLEQTQVEVISVYVYCFDEGKLQPYLNVASWDFCIVDETTMGITIFRELGIEGYPAAKWYFNDRNRLGLYSEIARDLRTVSTPFQTWWAENKHTWEARLESLRAKSEEAEE